MFNFEYPFDTKIPSEHIYMRYSSTKILRAYVKEFY